MAGLRVTGPGPRVHPWYRWAVLLYDRAYRAVHGLDRPPAQVGPALCLEVRRSRRARRLPDGTRVALGDRIGVIHVNNARIAGVRSEEHTSELQSHSDLVCRLLLEKKKYLIPLVQFQTQYF